MKLFPLSEFQDKSKGDIFKGYPITFDYALPQDWLDRFTKWCNQSKFYIMVSYNLISSTTIWVYPEGDYFGGPVTCCIEVYEALKVFMGEYWQNDPEKEIEREKQAELDRQREEDWYQE